MKSLSLSLTALVMLSGCSQSSSPTRAIDPVARIGAAPAVNESPLVLSVKAGSPLIAVDGILVLTLGFRNPGNEAIILGTAANPLVLELTNSQGEVAREFRLGGPFTIEAKQAPSFTLEIPAPSEPGLYRLTLRVVGGNETSPPCVVQVTPTRVGGGPPP